MTPRQKDTLDFIREFWKEHGFAPSYDEIRVGLGLKSKSSIGMMIEALAKRGYVRRSINEARSVTPVEIIEKLEDGEKTGIRAIPW